MRVVVDTNIVVAEMLRERGRRLFAEPALQLSMSEVAWSETSYEMRRRLGRLVEHGGWPEEQARQLLIIIGVTLATYVQPVEATVYQSREDEARERLPRDTSDWPTVALALALDAGIWTADRDFFGCGVPVWTTEPLQAYLRRYGDRA